MDAVKFLEEYNRMCNAYNDCVGCPMHDKPFCHPHDMTTNSELKNLVIAVERWSCEHSMVANDTSDTVSRGAAIDAIDRAVTKEAARWSLQEMPSAQPKRDIPLDCIIDESGNAICPKCGANVEWHKYCEECGQALKWEE